MNTRWDVKSKDTTGRRQGEHAGSLVLNMHMLMGKAKKSKGRRWLGQPLGWALKKTSIVEGM